MAVAAPPPGPPERRRRKGSGLLRRSASPPISGLPMPGDPSLAAFVADLEVWAKGNARDARFESVRFWALKLPAIFGSISTGIFGYAGWELASLIVGGAVAGCVAIDVLNPSSKLRNAHLRAVHDLRNLEHELLAGWAIEERGLDDDGLNELAAKLMRRGEREREKIADRLRDAETRLGVQDAPQ